MSPLWQGPALLTRGDLKQPGKIYSSRRKAKAIAEVLAMIADTHAEFALHHPHASPKSDEGVWESATEFCAAMDKYYVERMPRLNKPPSRRMA